ncbi:hypothetical protein ACRDNQ_12830 [Palleronia sp. KMU-117]|uniref:hypothetical protein n=1 Tax=Palleronia sp. KMU-117 TaxID=3434108 RepID=UPI003D7458B3
MSPRAGIAALILALVAAGAAHAQDTDGDGALSALRRTLELPGHRALMSEIATPGATLAPFVTDGCSGGLSTTWAVVADIFPGFAEAHEGRPPWEDCCVAHDRLYHDAAKATATTGADESFDARLAADEALRACVVAGGEARVEALAARYEVAPEQVRLAYRAIGEAMFNAVRFGGAPCSGLPWRWGFGYPGCFPALP